MTKSEFELITLIERRKKRWLQQELAEELNLSIGTINKVINELKELDLIEETNGVTGVTGKGYKKLEKYRVKRAVIMAAGLGSRMLPLTLYTPKPMIIVKGKPMIEIMLDSLLDKGIEEIYIVVGYLKGRMYELIEKYPMVKFIYNEEYISTNNTASVYLARNYLKNAYLLEADLYINNREIIRKYEYGPNCLGTYKEYSDDWVYKVKKNKIVGVDLGGENCYELCGISYFDEEAGSKIKNVLEKNYKAPGIKEHFIDEVYLNDFNKDFDFNVRECLDGDVLEFDTINDLKKFDELYDI